MAVIDVASALCGVTVFAIFEVTNNVELVFPAGVVAASPLPVSSVLVMVVGRVDV